MSLFEPEETANAVADLDEEIIVQTPKTATPQGGPPPIDPNDGWRDREPEPEAEEVKNLWRAVTVEVSALIGGVKKPLWPGHGVPVVRWGDIWDQILRRPAPIKLNPVSIEWAATTWLLPEGSEDMTEGGLILADGFVIPYDDAMAGTLSTEARHHYGQGFLDKESWVVRQMLHSPTSGMSSTRQLGGPSWSGGTIPLQAWQVSQRGRVVERSVPVRPQFWGESRTRPATHVIFDDVKNRLVPVSLFEVPVTPVPYDEAGMEEASISITMTVLERQAKTRGFHSLWFGFAVKTEADVAKVAPVQVQHWFQHAPGNKWYGVRYNTDALCHGSVGEELVFL